MTTINKNLPLRICDCGLADYNSILELQLNLSCQRRNGQIPNTVLLVEHPPVITLGARQSANKLLASPKELEQAHIQLVSIRRGGGSTAHNPGQIVFYPILNLKELDLDINEYVRTLESIGIELLKKFNIDSHRKKGLPGLWVNDKKIASIGVRVSKFITHHGMAVNIHNDLGIFDFIIPCGLDGIEVTSVYKEKKIKYPMEKVKEELAKLLVNYFSTDNLVKYEKIRQITPLASQTPAGQR